jgi:F0F1-type ATP synthase assembly protein I
LIFLWGGYKLDTHYNSSPLYIIIFAFLGFGTGFYNLINSLKNIDKIKTKSSEDTPKTNKWL